MRVITFFALFCCCFLYGLDQFDDLEIIKETDSELIIKIPDQMTFPFEVSLESDLFELLPDQSFLLTVQGGYYIRCLFHDFDGDIETSDVDDLFSVEFSNDLIHWNTELFATSEKVSITYEGGTGDDDPQLLAIKKGELIHFPIKHFGLGNLLLTHSADCSVRCLKDLYIEKQGEYYRFGTDEHSLLNFNEFAEGTIFLTLTYPNDEEGELTYSLKVELHQRIP